MPNFTNAKDASARTLDIYNKVSEKSNSVIDPEQTHELHNQ